MPNARTTSYTGKHRRQPERRSAGRSASRAAVLSIAGSLLASGTLIGVAEAATSTDFARLRACESSGNYRTNTGNGYYGAYQFDLGTWHGLGYGGRPDQASPATQDEAARRLQASRGWGPWPACSRHLGLGSGAPASRSTRRVPLASARVVSAHVSSAFRVTQAPAFGGATLRTALGGSARSDVRAWQRQMARRGFVIAIDGYYGPQSASVARAFQRQLRAGVSGIVGRELWRLSWEAPAK